MSIKRQGRRSSRHPSSLKKQNLVRRETSARVIKAVLAKAAAFVNDSTNRFTKSASDADALCSVRNLSSPQTLAEDGNKTDHGDAETQIIFGDRIVSQRPQTDRLRAKTGVVVRPIERKLRDLSAKGDIDRALIRIICRVIGAEHNRAQTRTSDCVRSRSRTGHGS